MNKENEKPFQRGGFQEDGTYIQEISRQTIGPEGEKGWYPPEEGQRIITRRGPFKVEDVVETFEVDGKKYFRAKGEVVKNND